MQYMKYSKNITRKLRTQEPWRNLPAALTASTREGTARLS